MFGNSAQRTAFDQVDDSNTSRDNTDDDRLVARGSKRQKLSGRTYKSGSAANEFSHDDYTVGWICALPIEMTVAAAMLDITHEMLPRSDKDSNTYTLGSIALHNVVIACLPSGYYGNNNATLVATNMCRTFPSIRWCLMVGIGGGAPGKVDVRLGDVVVSQGVLQYDLGKTVSDGSFIRTATINKPPSELLTAVAKLQADHGMGISKIPSILSKMLEQRPAMASYVYDDSLQDQLFDSTYEHVQSTTEWSTEWSTDNCKLCDISKLVSRRPRDTLSTKIHYGTIASGNQVIKNGKSRDKLAGELSALCFEMEGSGVMDGFTGLVIRGICDYADSHKNKQWQKVAAGVAAAYTKELLLVIPADSYSRTVPIVEVSDSTQTDFQLLELLKFEQIDARRSNIKPKYSTTCQWLLQHPDYLDWLDPTKAIKHHGFLWLRGGPGTGKSTLMAFARKESTEDQQRITISFFFNARGASLERTALGMYRSLLYQLLTTLPSLLSIFNRPQYKESLDCLRNNIIAEHEEPIWQIKALQDLLRSALAQLGEKHIVFFVDALDECAQDEVEELIEYFKELGEDSVRNGRSSRLNICFSSRYYPNIDIEYGNKVDLEEQDGHEQDIAMYIRNKLKIGKTKAAEQVKIDIQDKAKGIFMWVILVVDILKVEYKDGRIFNVKKRLNALPTKLSDLFKEILSRDQRNPRDLQLCIQWILFAKRPLKLEEYYFAIAIELSSDESQEWNPDEVTTEDMNKFVISSSKGLAETTRSKSRTVQFIHESVREFFLKDGLRELWPNIAVVDFESASHSQLQQHCEAYLQVDTSDHIPSPLPKASSDDAKELRATVSNKFPFLEYATQHIFYHADAAAHSVPQHGFLARFPLKDWISLANLFEKHEIRRYTPCVALLYILAENNFAKLIEQLLSVKPEIDLQGGRYQYPLFVALANGNHEAFNAILQVDASCAEAGLFQELYSKPKYSVKRGMTPLWWAIDKGYEAVVRLLLKRSVDVNAVYEYQTPLIRAAISGSTTIVRLLLDNGADIEVADDNGHRSLLFAAGNGSIAIMQLLLDKGAETQLTHGPNWAAVAGAAIRAAAKKGHIAIVRLLLKNGADISLKPGLNYTALQSAAQNGHTAIVQLLLDNGADVNLTGSSNQTALMGAAENGHAAIVQLLLDNGADISLKTSLNNTALQSAAENGRTAIVQLLLYNGADTEVKNMMNGSTALLSAVRYNHESIVRLLLKSGADIEARDSKGDTALSLALGKDKVNDAIVELLETQYYLSQAGRSI